MSKTLLIAIDAGRTSVSYDTKHPNKMYVSGVLVRLDEPSTKAPNGSKGHRIMVPSSVAASRLQTLVGMGLNYAPDLEGHAQRRKVGVITKAWIDGKDLCVKATVWKHDFPEAERDLKQSGLGMSMEIGEVQVADETAPVWKLQDFCFLGATILWKDAAAYHRTRAIAAAREERTMALKKPVKKPTAVASISTKQIAEIAAHAAVAATEKLLAPVIEIQSRQAVALDRLALAASAATVEAEADEDEEDVLNIDTASEPDDDDEDEDEEEDCAEPNMSTKKGKVKAAKKKAAPADDDEDDDDEDDDEMESEGVDHGDLEEMGPELGDDDEDDDDPGHLSQGAKNKGNKTTSENKIGKTENMGVTAARLKFALKTVRKLSAQMQHVLAENKKLRIKHKKLGAQVQAAAAQTERRSRTFVDPELSGLLAKANVDVNVITASGKKLSVEEMDGVLAGVAGLDTQKRMELKSRAARLGLMDEGRVDRGR